MLKSRWDGWRGQSNLIRAALSQSIHMPGHLSHVTQRTHTWTAQGLFSYVISLFVLPQKQISNTMEHNNTNTHRHVDVHLCGVFV